MKSQALHLIHLSSLKLSSSNDHIFMIICLNLLDFPDFVLLETLTSLLLRFTLFADRIVCRFRLEKYLAANRIGSEALNVMLLFLQSSEFKSTTERFRSST